MPANFQQKPRGPSGVVLGIAYIVLVFGLVAAAFPFGWNPASALVSGSGIAATAMIFAQFVTSGRFQWISGRIGLDVTMGFHRAAAAGVIIFVIVHILSLGLVGGLPGNVERIAVRIGHALTSHGNLTGLLAFILLVFLYVLARWFRGKAIPYEYWRISHGLGSVLIVLFSLAHILRRHDNILEPAPAAILLLLAFLAVASLMIIYVVRPHLAYGRGFVVNKVSRLTDSVVELELLTSAADRFSFKPGQFAWIATGGRHTVTDNPFSIASAPEELPIMRFMIREAGDATRQFVNLKPGTPVAVDGPYGNFTAHREASAVILVAGGIGIAPVLSILKSAAAKKDPRPHILVYAARTAADLAARQEIEALSAQLDLKVHLFLEEGPIFDGAQKGRLSKDVLLPLFVDVDCDNALVFLCGPPPMMDTVTGALLACNFPAERVITERFDYDAAQDPISWSIRKRFIYVLAIIAAGIGYLALAS